MAKRNKSNKSQAAMEFLLTYGWAILIVLVVIAALAYFGILSPSKLLPDKCFFQVGVSCVDFSASEGYPLGDTMVQTPDGSDFKIYSLNFDLINNLGNDVYVTSINVTGKDIDCTNIQYETCDPIDTSFIDFFFTNLNKEPPEVIFDPTRKCISITEACNKPEVCGEITPETIIRWPNGARLRQGAALINSDHLSMLCYKMPPKGEKTDGIITIEYTREDPTKVLLKHIIYGELHTTVT